MPAKGHKKAQEPMGADGPRLSRHRTLPMRHKAWTSLSAFFRIERSGARRPPVNFPGPQCGVYDGPQDGARSSSGALLRSRSM